jgi:hypothetical protein
VCCAGAFSASFFVFMKKAFNLSLSFSSFNNYVLWAEEGDNFLLAANIAHVSLVEAENSDL